MQRSARTDRVKRPTLNNEVSKNLKRNQSIGPPFCLHAKIYRMLKLKLTQVCEPNPPLVNFVYVFVDNSDSV